MLKRFEKFLAPTKTPSQAEPPATLIGFYWHFARQAKGLFAMLFVAGFVVALFDATIPVFIGRVVTLITASDPKTLVAEQWHILAGMAAVLLIGRPLAHHRAEPRRQPGDRGQRRQHDPLAEPLARGAPELGVFPERFRRPHRQQGDADRPGLAREPGLA